MNWQACPLNVNNPSFVSNKKELKTKKGNRNLPVSDNIIANDIILSLRNN